MVFYGRKTPAHNNNQLQYKSIREQILKEIGQRQRIQNGLIIQQESIASILSNCGNLILTFTQKIINARENFKNTQFYVAYQMDRKTFKQEIKPNVQFFNNFSYKLTQNKFYLINKLEIGNRLLLLNGSVFLISLLAATFTKGSISKFRAMLGSSLIGYSIGGLIIVPQIYNPIFVKNIV